jgi:hypothetical protein
MHWPAVNADMSEITAFRRASLSKSMTWGLKSEYHRHIGIGGTKHGRDTKN